MLNPQPVYLEEALQINSYSPSCKSYDFPRGLVLSQVFTMAQKDGGVSTRQRGSKSNEKKPDVVGSSLPIKNMAVGPMITLLIFSTAMLILPLSTYFYIRRYLVDSTTYGAMGAIVMVQLIIAAYIYKAWTDENEEHQQQIREKDKKK